MRASKTVIVLSLLAAVLAAASAGAGLFWRAEGNSFFFTTLRNQTVEIYGQDIYRYDTLDKVASFRGADAVVLFPGIPLLLGSLVLYKGGSLRGHLFLTGILSLFLYHSAYLALGVAFNSLFLLYVAYFSSSLFAFILAFSSVDSQHLAAHLSPRLLRRGMIVFLFLAGSVVFVWLILVIEALLQARAPEAVASYTTELTFVIDLAITAPVSFTAAVLLIRRRPSGYVLASTLLILYVMVGLIVAAQSVVTELYGIQISAGDFVTFVGSFLTMSMIATWLTIAFFRAITPPSAPQAGHR